MNGLNVDQATYDHVIKLIKQTPSSKDIHFRVINLGKIPFQEKLNEPIKWLIVDGYSQSMASAGELDVDLKGSSLASSANDDDGIDMMMTSSTTGSSLKLQIVDNINSSISSNELLEINSTGSSSSVVSISSARSESMASPSSLNSDEESPIQEVYIRVPGFRRQPSVSFGCGVVKGLDEWPGIFVQNVKLGSLAERVGLELGDQLIKADNQLLSELTFDMAIKLIKQKQIEQHELVLLVKKGAALKYLASCNKLKQQKLHESAEQRLELVGSSDAATGGELQLAGVKGANQAPQLEYHLSRPAADENNNNNLISGTQSQLSDATTTTRAALPEAQESIDIQQQRRQANWSSSKLAELASETRGGSYTGSGSAKLTKHNSETVNDEPRPGFAAAKLGQDNCAAGDGNGTADPETAADQAACSGDQRSGCVKRSCSGNDDNDEQIKIVSQSCRLHHMNRLNSRRRLSSLQQQQQTASRSALTAARPQAAGPQFVAARRRQQQTVAQHQQLQQHRYVSMDNLSVCAAEMTPRRVSQLSSRPKLSSATEVCYPAYERQQRQRVQRLYQRSNSVLGQHSLMSCCAQVSSSHHHHHHHKQLAQANECALSCCQPQQPRQIGRYQPANRYNTVGMLPLNAMLMRSKARSMDKLNMNINLNYVKIGLNSTTTTSSHHHHQLAKAQQFPPAELSPVCRECLSMQHHIPAPKQKQQQIVYHQYATASGMISSKIGAAADYPSHHGAGERLDSCTGCCYSPSPQPLRAISCQRPAAGACCAACSDQASISQLMMACQTAGRPARPQSQASHHQPLITRTQRRCRLPAHKGDCCGCGGASGCGATTDSSGYLSANSDSRKYQQSRGQPARLLKLCAAEHHRQLPAPPQPPPLPSGQLRDTRQRLSTFKANVMSGTQMGANKQQLVSKSAITEPNIVSPVSLGSANYSSLPRPSSISSLAATTSDSSLDLEPISSTSSGGNLSSSPSSNDNILVCKVAKNKVPCPPPMPAKEAQFEFKLKRQLLGGLAAANLTAESGGSPKQRQEAKTKSSRLCFVDELKMLAKKSDAAQQQQSANQKQSNQVEVDSSTLIKIINASKANGSKGCSDCNNCGCKPAGNKNRSASEMQLVCSRSNCSLKPTRQPATAALKSVKLSEEDNKRRQHGKYKLPAAFIHSAICIRWARPGRRAWDFREAGPIDADPVFGEERDQILWPGCCCENIAQSS